MRIVSRIKNTVVALGLLLLPVSSGYSVLDRFKNPVVALELSQRYRRKAYVIVTTAVYAVYAVYSFSILVYAVTEKIREDPRPRYSSRSWDFGDMLGFLVSPVVPMIFLVVPVLAAVSVVGERRRGTLMLVQLSSLRPFDIVWGKVVASVAPVLFPVVVCVVVLASFSPFAVVLNAVALDMDIKNLDLLFVSAEIGTGLVVSAEIGTGLVVSAGIGIGLVVLSIAVSVSSVLCSTFAKSSASAITMSYGLSFLSQGVWIVGLPFWCWWACRRLRLPAEK